MTKTLRRSVTIRLPEPLQRRLKRRARERGETPSEIVRSMLERELTEQSSGDGPTLYELTAHLIGSIDAPKAPRGRGARRVLAAWRPDRRA